jgi:hypothetical protein
LTQRLRAAIPLEQMVINDELQRFEQDMQILVLTGLAAVRGLIAATAEVGNL